MRVVKIVLLTLLSLVVAAILSLFVLHYVIWPKPDILELVPDAPIAYVAASNLDRILLSDDVSKFSRQVRASPIWKEFARSEPGKKLRKEERFWKRQWEKSMGQPVDLESIVRLVEKDALLAFFGEQNNLEVLLASKVGTFTRINIMSWDGRSGSTPQRQVTREKYKGTRLTMIRTPDWQFSYAFIGRAGLLSTDVSLLKKTVDLHKEGAQGLATTPLYRRLVADLPESDVSFYADTSRILAFPELSRLFSLVPGIGPALLKSMKRVDAWAGVGSQQNGDLRLDNSLYLKPGERVPRHEVSSGRLVNVAAMTPAECLLFMSYGTMNPAYLFRLLGTAVGPELDTVRDKLLPALGSGAAVAILKPDVEELQLLPPVMIFLQVEDKPMAREALQDIEVSTQIGDRLLQFNEVEHENVPISYARVPIGMGMSLDAGYTFLGDEILVIATDTSALKAAIEVSLGKRQSLIENEGYAKIQSSIGTDSDGQVFLDVRSTAAIAKQAARLYALRARIAGEREAERLATRLCQNAYLLEMLQYASSGFHSSDGRISFRIILSK